MMEYEHRQVDEKEKEINVTTTREGEDEEREQEDMQLELHQEIEIINNDCEEGNDNQIDTNNSENENSLVKYLIDNREECQQLIGEIIKIEQLDLNMVKDYLNMIEFNGFLKCCTKNKIFKSYKSTITTDAAAATSSFSTTKKLSSANKSSKRITKRTDSSGSDFEFIANSDGGGEYGGSSALNTNNNLLNQKKSLRLKKKNLLFKKLIEREKNDYYDYSIDEDYTMNNSEASIVGENEKTSETILYAEQKSIKKPNIKNKNNLPGSSNNNGSSKIQTQQKPQNEPAIGMVNVMVNGKSLIIHEKDYKQFVRCGKWCSLEFFRVEMSDDKQDCLFCKRKCKTTIDNVYICVLCRNFAYKTLSKHLAYVCKERFITPELCKMPRKINDFSKDKYCRFCYFYNIFHALERLTRLQKYLVEFKNKTLIFLNSGPKKVKPANENESDLDDQENRDVNNDSSNNNSFSNVSNSASKKSYTNTNQNLIITKSEELDNENDENMSVDQSTDMNDECDGLLNIENDYYDLYNNYFETSIYTNNNQLSYQRTGPRVKHVSRREPIALKLSKENEYNISNSCNSIALYNSTNNYINHLNLQSINNFQLRLSALPDKEKRAFINQFRLNRRMHTASTIVNQSSNQTLNVSHVEAAINNTPTAPSSLAATSSTTILSNSFSNHQHQSDLDDEIASLHNKNQSSLKIFRKKHELSSIASLNQSQQQESSSGSQSIVTRKKLTSHRNDDFCYEEQIKKKKLKRTSSQHVLGTLTNNSHGTNSSEEQNILSRSISETLPIQHYVFTGWDDYFERFHKISTNQSVLLRVKNVNNNENSSNTDLPLVAANISENIGDSSVNYGKSERLKFKGITQKLFKETEPYAMNLVHTYSPSNLTNLNSCINNNQVYNNYSSNLNYVTNNLLWDMQPDYDIFEIWKHGYPILSQKPICIKSACYLCGSLGVDSEQLLYCNVCCEPFHSYCIEDYERPKETTHKLNWICPTCKFCEICGLQNDLLHCARCENCFHSTCFKKSNYPKKPTKKSHLWVCYDCFKCKSCGTTNMNYDPKIYFKMPNYDYNFCFDCDKQISSGDYCRICKTGYNKEILDASQQTALESKMIKCSTCSYWSHSNCANLSSENFDILFDISPNIIKFNCKICNPDANYDDKLVEYKNETLLHIVNELKSNVKLVLDETVEFEASFATMEQKLATKSYTHIKSFMNDFDCLENDEKFENNLFFQLKTSLLELMKEKFKYINPNELTAIIFAPVTSSVGATAPATIATCSTSNHKNEKKKIKRILKKAQKDEAATAAAISTGDMSELEIKELTANRLKNLTNIEQIIVKIPYEDHTYALSASSLNLLESLSTPPVEQPQQKQESCGLEKRATKKSKILASKLNTLAADKCIVKDWENKQSGIDTRKCYLCQINGDHDKCGRLVAFDLNWIHLNCLLWSQDVLVNEHIIEQVQLLTSKLKNSSCKHCCKEGATIQCKYKNCESIYHFNCSVLSECVLTSDRILYCKNHYEEYEIFSFNLFKNFDQNHQCFIVNVDSYRKKYSFPVFSINSIYILIGSMQVTNLGDIDSISDSEDVLYPIDYCCSRVYWSAFEIGKKVLYKCKIKRVNSTHKQENELTICHDEMIINNGQFNSVANTDTQIDQLNDLMMYQQTDGNSDYFLENDDNLSDRSSLTISADAAVAATSTVTLTNIDTSNSSNRTNSQVLNIKHDFSSYFNKFKNQNQTLSKIFSLPETTIDVRSPTSSSSSSSLSTAPSIKPRVLKLPNDYNKVTNNVLPTVSNIQSTGRIDKSGIRNESLNQAPSISFFMPSGAVSSFINKQQQHQLNVDISSGGLLNIRNNFVESNSNDDNISPKSDKSDSSLKLDYSSIINYPFSTCYGGDEENHLQLQLQIQQQIQHQLLLQQQQQQQQQQVDSSQQQYYQVQIMPESEKKSSKRGKTKQALNGGDLNFDYNEYHSEKQNLLNKAKNNLINPRTVITKCSKARSQHTIKQLLDNFDSMNKKIEQEAKFKDLSSSSSPTKSNTSSNTPTSSLALLLNSERPFQRHVHDVVEQTSIESQINFNASCSPSTSSVSSNSLNVKISKIGTNSKPSKRKCSEILSENENAMNSSVNNEEPVNNKRATVLGELNENLKVEVNDLNGCDLIFEITSEDGLFVQSKDINDAWKKVTERVNKLRVLNNLKQLSHQGINGLTMYGLNNKTVSYLLEQFDSVQYCNLYKPKYIPKRISDDDSWRINVDGCVRSSQPFDKNTKRCTDYFHWLTSNQRNDYYFMNRNFDDTFWLARKALLSPEISSQMKYRHLKNFSKRALVVKRSPIHGRGLFTLTDLQQGQMIIEYSGEIIRNQLCDKREKYYETKGIGCYMFRIDEQDVIDATRKGNQARFINHSCDPNCISKVLIIHGHKHIVIFAQRFINKSEELTYDYKFPKEDIKIQCLCKSVKCRKYLN